MTSVKVKAVKEELDISSNVAKELLDLAGGDEELVFWASRNTNRLSACKAKIIDGRFDRIERTLDQCCFED